MPNKKIGLVLSHVYVREGERYKFDMINYVIGRMKRLGNFFVVLSGHGPCLPTEQLSKQIDAIYWDGNVREEELGRGHPKFCIKGFEICKQNNIQKVVKLRAFDYLVNKDRFEDLVSQEAKIIVSE